MERPYPGTEQLTYGGHFAIWWMQQAKQLIEQARPYLAGEDAARRLWEYMLESADMHEIHGFQVLDSGQRKCFGSGMVRDINDEKVRYDLCFDGPMFKRWATHLTLGAKKYEPRNWMKAQGHEELDRFRDSAVRHFIQWLEGQPDEDHAAAVMFNINGFEYVKERMANECGCEPSAPLAD